MKQWINRYREHFLLGAFYALVAFALIAPVAIPTDIPSLADFINHLSALTQAKIAFTEGQFPLRVMPIEMAGWRYPFYQFYSRICACILVLNQ